MMTIHDNATLEERVGVAFLRVLMIAAPANAPDVGAADSEDVLGAIAEAAHETAEVLRPLTDAPAEIANWKPEGGVR